MTFENIQKTTDGVIEFLNTLHKVEEGSFSKESVLDIVALIMMGSEHISLPEAKQDYPKLFAGKREKAKEWFNRHEKWFEQNVG